jgi:hypothetical protein
VRICEYQTAAPDADSEPVQLAATNSVLDRAGLAAKNAVAVEVGMSTPTYVEVIEAVQRDALDGHPIRTHWRRFEPPIVVKIVVKRLKLAC